jgi:hypothetical protein
MEKSIYTREYSLFLELLREARESKGLLKPKQLSVSVKHSRSLARWSGISSCAIIGESLTRK